MSLTNTSTGVPSWEFELAVEAEADGIATAEQLDLLDAERLRWRDQLRHLLRDTEDALRAERSGPGGGSHQVIVDLESERRRLSDAWARLTGEGDEADDDEPAEAAADAAPEIDDEVAGSQLTQIQLSWEPGRVVAWAAGYEAPTGNEAELVSLLERTGAPSSGWVRHGDISPPGGGNAPAMAIPVGDVLGWLVAVGAGQPEFDDPATPEDEAAAAVELLGASARWLGQVAIWAVELTARGSMVPLLRQRRSGKSNTSQKSGSFSVRWTPAVLDAERLRHAVDEMPGAVRVRDPGGDPRALVRSALTGMVDAICRDAARRIEVPAPPPQTRTATDVAEAMLSRLDGSAFNAPLRVAGDVVNGVGKWAASVIGEHEQLIVQLDPPESDGAWNLLVLAPASKGAPRSVEQAIAEDGSRRIELERQLARLERMIPALLRPGGTRRGQVILSQEEAWELMTTTGPQLAAIGYDVRVPALSRKRPKPSLRLFADSSSPSAAGANQLADVRWSAMFGDVELTAAEIARLAKEARPLIRSGGRWVAVDAADLQEAAAALAEREDTTQLTGAEMLRLAMGLEGPTLAGGVTVAGNSWAADLLRRASDLETQPITASEGFVGDLRSYQADALAWLGFLDGAGLGGCLALDMGLGKTPTMLAHLRAGVGSGPSLVIAPPAVVGNWFAEAHRFTPDLRVVVHHGSGRAAADEIERELADADVVITTYGTAVRDIDALEDVAWDKVVLDEAQAVKNPTNDTSQQLRRLKARMRVALTGTPIENGLGDLWAILDFTNPGLVGSRPEFVARLSHDETNGRVEAEDAMRALNGILVFRRTKAEPAIAAELPDRIDELDHCSMTPEQIGLYQAVLDKLVVPNTEQGEEPGKGRILAAITALKQICNHPAAYERDDRPLAGRSGKLARLEEIVDAVFAAGEKVLVFTHFAEWGERLATHLTERTGLPVDCYHGGLTRTARDKMIADFQGSEGAGALVLSLKAGGTGLNLTAASHVVLFDRWWNPAVEDQARDRAWRIGQTKTVIAHRLVCPGTVDERVEEVVEGKRRIADMVLPKSSSLADLDSSQLRTALGIRPDQVLTEELDDASAEPALQEVAS